jgi:hypothetical protein
MPYQFRGQREDEEVVLMVRHHPLVLLHPMLLVVGIFLIPFFLYIFIALGTILFWTAFICLVAGITYAMIAAYKWYNSIMMLTTQRVVVVRQHGLMNREMSECGLASIQQISHEVKGALKTLFDYGEIQISIGNSQNNIIVHNMPKPYDIQQEILKAGQIKTV